jgi:hypothetical protein
MEASKVRDPAEAALAVTGARDRLLELVGHCSDDQWHGSPFGDEDPRSVGVIVDHVADAYGYLGGWVRALLEGESVEVTGAVVDGLNASHAAEATGISRDAVRQHLMQGGDEFAALAGGLRPDQFALGDGAVGRFVDIAARHADAHRSELEAALGFESGRSG